MRRVVLGILLVVLLPVLAGLSAEAALISKSYKFKEGVILDIGASAGGGLRVDTVRFQLPPNPRGRIGGHVRADVAISNSGDHAQKVGIAIALFDERGRLVGVASGGSQFLSIKPNRQSTYTLIFDDVNSEAHRATIFQITIESK